MRTQEAINDYTREYIRTLRTDPAKRIQLNEIARSRYAADPSLRKKLSVKRGRSPRAFLVALLGHARQRAKKCSLTTEQLIQMYETQDGKCFYSGIQMTWIAGNGRIDTNISLDRIDTSRGYTRGNVVLCCYFINMSKHTKTTEQWLHWAEAVHRYHVELPQVLLEQPDAKES